MRDCNFKTSTLSPKKLPGASLRARSHLIGCSEATLNFSHINVLFPKNSRNWINKFRGLYRYKVETDDTFYLKPLVNTCTLLQHLQNDRNCDYPIRHDDILRCSFHHQHNGHHPAKFDMDFGSHYTNHNSVYSRPLQCNSTCDK